MSVIFVANKLVVSLFGFLMILKASMADLSGFLVLYPPPPPNRSMEQQPRPVRAGGGGSGGRARHVKQEGARPYSAASTVTAKEEYFSNTCTAMRRGG